MKKLSATLLMLLIPSLAFADISLDSFQQLVSPDDLSPHRIIEHDNSGTYLVQRNLNKYLTIEQGSFTNVNETLFIPLLIPLSTPPFTPLFTPLCAGIQQSAALFFDQSMVADRELVTDMIQRESYRYPLVHKPEFAVEIPDQNIGRKPSGVYVERHFNSATKTTNTLRKPAMLFMGANMNASTCLAKNSNALPLSPS
ncbi:MAG: hypothetical protein V4628_03415 [Pseudomonadota bacterium]